MKFSASILSSSLAVLTVVSAAPLPEDSRAILERRKGGRGGAGDLIGLGVDVISGIVNGVKEDKSVRPYSNLYSQRQFMRCAEPGCLYAEAC
jgi:hypothetical protein